MRTLYCPLYTVMNLSFLEVKKPSVDLHHCDIPTTTVYHMDVDFRLQYFDINRVSSSYAENVFLIIE